MTKANRVSHAPTGGKSPARRRTASILLALMALAVAFALGGCGASEPSAEDPVNETVKIVNENIDILPDELKPDRITDLEQAHMNGTVIASRVWDNTIRVSIRVEINVDEYIKKLKTKFQKTEIYNSIVSSDYREFTMKNLDQVGPGQFTLKYTDIGKENQECSITIYP